VAETSRKAWPRLARSLGVFVRLFSASSSVLILLCETAKSLSSSRVKFPNSSDSFLAEVSERVGFCDTLNLSLLERSVFLRVPKVKKTAAE
jgi:hypothetical protein